MKLLVPGKQVHPVAFRRILWHFYSTIARDSLYRRISPVGDPNVSVIPVLDQWVREGRPVQREELQKIIKELRIYKRFKHALEVCFLPFAVIELISMIEGNGSLAILRLRRKIQTICD